MLGVRDVEDSVVQEGPERIKRLLRLASKGGNS